MSYVEPIKGIIGIPLQKVYLLRILKIIKKGKRVKRGI